MKTNKQLDLFCYMSGSAITITVLMMLLMIDGGSLMRWMVEEELDSWACHFHRWRYDVQCTHPCSACTHHCSNVDQAWIYSRDIAMVIDNNGGI